MTPKLIKIVALMGVLLPMLAFSQVRGIDVSKYQGNIGWSRVASSGKVAYVYVKATEGTTIQDPMYASNVKGAREAGLPVGSYHLYSSKTSAYDQFANFKRLVRKSEQDLVPMLDIEERYSNGLNVERVDKLLELMEREYGVKPLIYTSEHVYFDHFATKKYEGYQIFVANYHYFPKCRFTLWQFSQTGKVPGISGYVDMSELSSKHKIEDIMMP